MKFLNATYKSSGSLTTLDLDRLWADNIRGLVFDLDNTLMLPSAGSLQLEIITYLQKARDMGFRIAILSNNTKEKYAQKVQKYFADEWNISMLYYGRKPNNEKLLELIRSMQLQPQQVCVIGDRVLTDVWVAARTGCASAMLYPLIGRSESPILRLLRELERALFLH